MLLKFIHLPFNITPFDLGYTGKIFICRNFEMFRIIKEFGRNAVCCWSSDGITGGLCAARETKDE